MIGCNVFFYVAIMFDTLLLASALQESCKKNFYFLLWTSFKCSLKWWSLCLCASRVTTEGIEIVPNDFVSTPIISWFLKIDAMLHQLIVCHVEQSSANKLWMKYTAPVCWKLLNSNVFETDTFKSNVMICNTANMAEKEFIKLWSLLVPTSRMHCYTITIRRIWILHE